MRDGEAKLVPDPVGLVGITFTKNWKKWFKGDRAGFLPDQADRLVRAGAAQYVPKTAVETVVEGAKAIADAVAARVKPSGGREAR